MKLHLEYGVGFRTNGTAKTAWRAMAASLLLGCFCFFPPKFRMIDRKFPLPTKEKMSGRWITV